MNKLLCLGYGYVARRLAGRLTGAGWAVAGTIRDAARAAGLSADGVTPVLWSSGALVPDVTDANAILVSTPPADGGCPALALMRETRAAPGWIGYLSTNGVYGDHQGAVVDETSPLLATSPRGLARIAAENAWRTFAAAQGAQLVIFRLPGIYGPGRSAFDQIREGRAQRIVKPGQVFSRMHVEDIARAVEASLFNPGAGTLFNLADDEPAPPQDVIDYACRLLGVEPPPLIPFEQAALSDMARSFYADNKRVSNALMKRALGVSLRYPTYREGLRAILEAQK
ncbi:MAG: SDR family oxidoreductase [Parvularculaceae bacterium]|nr:SDR family oxidoreductase [Parvularculaceae bacterium]